MNETLSEVDKHLMNDSPCSVLRFIDLDETSVQCKRNYATEAETKCATNDLNRGSLMKLMNTATGAARQAETKCATNDLNQSSL
eukprot:CAMPEP_0185747600 /NCGR_PEP_ID=MMETSP1174-20130828/6224_1 /TAXON_ID=35687 /ORGANISM="Dictyocha speculum, Strain CCMP1381" /LENGTH=83 /DNA_ID=CAMNT_0028422845 /DNA_START=45 /DNA_END=292 /DNA_ORIENTATION=+